MASLRKELLQKHLPPLQMTTNASRKTKKEYTPLSWEGYFDSMTDVKIEERKIFRVYQSGVDCSPVVLLLHGGGHSALSWGLFSVRNMYALTCNMEYVLCNCFA
jgi:acetyl esterase/lipase